MKAFEIVSPSRFILKKEEVNVLGEIDVLFPVYNVKTKFKNLGITKTINDHHSVKAKVARWGHYGCLISQDGTCLINSYWFSKDTTDMEVFSYLQMNKGWTPSLHRKVRSAFKYKNPRNNYSEKIYGWEENTLPKVPITNDQIYGLYYEYLGNLVDLNFIEMKEYGKCSLVRNSGLVGKPVRYELKINPNSQYLWVVLHELAHALDYQYYRAANHGITFLKIYSSLLKKYHQINYWPSIKTNILQG